MQRFSPFYFFSVSHTFGKKNMKLFVQFCNLLTFKSKLPPLYCCTYRIILTHVSILSVVKCPAIRAPSHGRVFPSPCKLLSGVHYKTECYFNCDVSAGYQPLGARNVSCLENGSWSADVTNVRCRGT